MGGYNVASEEAGGRPSSSEESSPMLNTAGVEGEEAWGAGPSGERLAVEVTVGKGLITGEVAIG